jgi:hypothetical protein
MALLCRPMKYRLGTLVLTRIDTRVGSQRGVPDLDLTHNQVHFYILKILPHQIVRRRLS